MKRTIIALLLLVPALGLFAGGKAETKAPQSTGPVTIVYYLWDDPSIKPIVEAFSAAQKDIIVDARYIPSPDYETKITTLLTARAEMDAYNQKTQSHITNHYSNGFLEPLDPYLKQPGIDTSAVEKYKDTITIDGKVLGFPWRGAAQYVYYNKKLFEKAGVPTPDVYVKQGTWTWDKFAEVARKVSSGDGEVYGALVYIWLHHHLLIESQRRKPIIDNNGKIDYSDGIYKFFRMRKSLEEAKAMWPLIDLKVTKTHYSKAFYDGRVAMLIIGEWFPGMMNRGRDENLLKGYTWNDWGVTRLPCDEKKYINQGLPTFNHVTSFSKKKEPAFRFIAWMGGGEGAKVAAKAGVLPAIMTPEVKQILAKSLPDAQSLEYFTENFEVNGYMSKYGGRYGDLLNKMLEEYLLGKLSDADFDARLRAGLEEIVKTTTF